MEIILHEINNVKIAEIKTDDVVLNTVQDALDIMADADYNGARKIILHEENINTGFFKLGTGLAGDILQKFVNYHFKLAVVGDFKKYASRNFKSFVYESNTGNNFFFVSDVTDALNKFSGKSVV